MTFCCPNPCVECPIIVCTQPLVLSVGQLQFNPSTDAYTFDSTARGKATLITTLNISNYSSGGSGEKEIIDLGEIRVTEQLYGIARVVATSEQLAALATLTKDKLLLVRLTSVFDGAYDGFADSSTGSRIGSVELVDTQNFLKLQINFSAKVYYGNSVTRLLHVAGYSQENVTSPFARFFPYSYVPLLSSDYTILPNPHVGNLSIGEPLDAALGIYAATVQGGQGLDYATLTQLISITLPQTFPDDLHTLILAGGPQQIINIPVDISAFGTQVVGLLVDSTNGTSQFILPYRNTVVPQQP